ncbi:hypothetical protein FG379_002038 [Cryptosporidium bovis]|uniref:uncharacterized protein n=1 Tax=Cryptosporidium bovis TaxID=310047 RepID=UPI00351A47AB|nr:hypothetical protein FG379_002038 [Cryptosporidium bovis]
MLSTDIVSAGALQSRTKLELIRKKIYSFFLFDLNVQIENNDIDDTNFELSNKLLYFFPGSLSIATIRHQVGLVEGFISISSILINDGKEINYVRTRKHEISFKRLNDTSIVVCMITLLPHYIRSNSGKVMTIDFSDDDFNDRIYSQDGGLDYKLPYLKDSTNFFSGEDGKKDSLMLILDRFTETFNLLHGDLLNINRDNLISILEDFVPGFLDTIDLSTLSFATSVDGFYFAPVERQIQISVINLVEATRNKFDDICHVTILFDAHLIYSTLDNLSSKILYNYLVLYNGVASNDKLCNEPFGRFPRRGYDYEERPLSSFGRCNRFSGDGFLFGPITQGGARGKRTDFVFSPRIFLPDHVKEGYKLVAFTYKEIMIVVLLKGDEKKRSKLYKDEVDPELNEEMNFCFKMRKHMIDSEGGIRDLYSDILNQFITVMNLPDSFRFFYLNKANNAVRRSNKLFEPTNTLMSSVEGDCVWGTAALVLDESSRVSEISFKSGTEGWVICKKSLDRIFYLFFENPETTYDKIMGKLNQKRKKRK